MLKPIVKKIIQFILLFSIVIPCSFAIINTDIFFKQEVSHIAREIKSTDHKSPDSLFSELNDSVEEIILFTLFPIANFNTEKYFFLASRFNFLLSQKIPFKLLSIPPPFT